MVRRAVLALVERVRPDCTSAPATQSSSSRQRESNRGPKPASRPKTEPNNNQKNSENNPSHRRFWLWRALGKVAHPRGQQGSEVKP